MDHGVYESFKPDIVRNQVLVFKPACPCEPPNGRQQSANYLLSLLDLAGEWAIEPVVVDKLLHLPRQTLILAKAKDTDVGVGEKLLRVRTEEQDGGSPWITVLVDEVSSFQRVEGR